MRHKITHLMMCKTICSFKIFQEKKFKNFNLIRQKKFFLANFQNFRVRHAIYRFSMRRTRCNRLKFFWQPVIYINDFIFQNSLSLLCGLGGRCMDFFETVCGLFCLHVWTILARVSAFGGFGSVVGLFWDGVHAHVWTLISMCER